MVASQFRQLLKLRFGVLDAPELLRPLIDQLSPRFWERNRWGHHRQQPHRLRLGLLQGSGQRLDVFIATQSLFDRGPNVVCSSFPFVRETRDCLEDLLVRPVEGRGESPRFVQAFAHGRFAGCDYGRSEGSDDRTVGRQVELLENLQGRRRGLQTVRISEW